MALPPVTEAAPAASATTPGRKRSDRSPLTGRAALLAVVVGALVLSTALPVREYVRQRGEISALRDEKAAREARVAELQNQLQQWQDPAYVSAQARKRLQYVLPGEVGYVVLDPAEAPAPADVRATAARVADRGWYSRLWSTVEAADQEAPALQPKAKPAPKPAPKPTSTP